MMQNACTRKALCYRKGTMLTVPVLIPGTSFTNHFSRQIPYRIGRDRCSYQDFRHEDAPAWHSNQLTESVERLVVEPVIRTAPWDVERLRQQEHKPQACLLLISESDVCRSVLAAASLRLLLAEAGLDGRVELATCGTRPYNLGEPVEPAAAAAAEALGLELPTEHAARLFDPAHDIVSYDLLLVMDKFTAGDVMREVSSFDLVNRTTQFSYKVRRLGEFLAVPAAHGSSANQHGSDGDELDIEDPLYGNYGGQEEEQAVLRAARAIWESCRGLVAFLQQLSRDPPQEGDQQQQVGTTPPHLGPALRAHIQTLGPTAWLAPPMLSPRVAPERLPSF